MLLKNCDAASKRLSIANRAISHLPVLLHGRSSQRASRMQTRGDTLAPGGDVQSELCEMMAALRQ